MYSYNSSHKIIVILLVFVWAIYQFSGKNDEGQYYDNGQIKRTGTQVNSLNQGEFVWYFENGKKQIKGRFDRGKRVGTWEQYDSLGHLILSSEYKNNHLDGLNTSYSENGSIESQQIYRNDTVVKKVELQ